MPNTRFRAAHTVTVLRPIEVLMSQGKAAPVACREAGISQQSYYRWRRDYGACDSRHAFCRHVGVACSRGHPVGR